MKSVTPSGSERAWAVAVRLLWATGVLTAMILLAPRIGWYLWMMNSFIPLNQLAIGYLLIGLGIVEIGFPIWLAVNWKQLARQRRAWAIGIWSGVLIVALANIHWVSDWLNSPLGGGPPSTVTKAPTP